MNANNSSRSRTPDSAQYAAVWGLRFLIIGLTIALAGCTSQQETKAAADVGALQVCVADVDKAEAMQKAEETLIDMHFDIEKADPDTGLIRTHPLSGAQFFELWRKDSVGSFNKTEANLHSIRRIVTLEVINKDRDTCIGCEVVTQRLNLPEHDVSSSARAYAIFTKSSGSLQRMRLYPEQRGQVGWVDVGKDGRLAARILERIEQQISETGGEN